MAWTLQQIVEITQGTCQGANDLTIENLGTLDDDQPNMLTYIGDDAHASRWSESPAVAALVPTDLTIEPGPDRALIRVENVDLAMAALLEKFAPPTMPVAPGIHPTAVVDPTAKLGETVCIGPYVVIGKNVTIGSGSQIHAHVNLADDVTLGSDCVIWSGTVIRERCTLGDRVICQPNVNLGADGFGYRPDPQGKGLVKIPHLGAVTIGNDVEIGAGSAIDRGKFADTTVGDGTKIDNLVQIGHNCRIGRCVVIAGGCGIGGTTTLGDGCIIGGMCAIRDHATFGPGVTLAGGSQLMHDKIPAGETWGGSPAREMRNAIRVYAALEKLPGMFKDLRKMKKKLG